MTIGGLALGGEVPSNLPTPRSDQELMNFINTGNGLEQTIYTVPTGKKFYCAQVSISKQAGGASLSYLYKNGTIILVVNVIAGDTKSIPFPTPILFDSGDTIGVLSNIAQTTVIGWEE